MDYEISQVGITHIPQFGWILESDKRDVMQDSYELEIALDDVFTEKVYAGGKVESDASAQVLPEGLTLRS